MTEELEFLWYHMKGDFGLLMALISWVTALRLCLKPVSKFIEDYIASVGVAEAAWAVKMTSHPVWHFIAFLLDYLASVKLPTKKKESVSGGS